MKKFVLKLDLEGDDREKQRRALKTVATLTGIDEITVDAKGKKLTVIGTVDPITVVSKLRKKYWQADIVSVGPAKEPEKKEEPKKEEAKKDEPGKEEPKKDDAQKEDPKKEEGKKDDTKKDGEKKAPEPELVIGTAMQYRPYYPPMNTYYYVNHSVEENPNGCTIC